MADSIREALTAAYDAAGKEPPTEEAAPAEPIQEPAAAVAAPDEKDSPPSAEAKTEPQDEGEPKPAETKPEASKPAAPVAEPAPASWNKEEKEAWSGVPEKARAAVKRREQDFQRVFQATAQARRRAEAFDQIALPYQPLLQKYGIGLEQALPPLLATRAALEVGTKEQKAQLVANICADFGIDIELLDTALQQRFSGTGTPQPIGPPPQIDLRSNPQLAPLFQMAEEVAERRSQQARETVAQVQTEPHYEEVRFTMADLIDQAKAQGRSLDIKRAYRLACQVHGFEDAAPATPQAGAPPSVSEAAAILARSRKAASSVGSSGPKPTPLRKPGEGTVRDEITAQIEAASRG
jgi:hypothetical protein